MKLKPHDVGRERLRPGLRQGPSMLHLYDLAIAILAVASLGTLRQTGFRGQAKWWAFAGLALSVVMAFMRDRMGTPI